MSQGTKPVSLSLSGRNPDVLTCIANLSNDEVFTPPELSNQMLDLLAETWARDNGGADIWADPTVTFLDPFTKSGVFLREITSRLTKGLEGTIPDLQDRVDHILTKQIFGIAITHLTALLARRSVYCSKFADGQHSIARTFGNPDGNVWFEPVDHMWSSDRRCSLCGASESMFDRGEGLESHAYALIHTDNPRDLIALAFGDDMQFDVIIGNPPYQIDDEGGHRPVPLYQKFVTQAKALEPKYLVMVTPSRWMAGGLGLGSFRAEMLSDKRIRTLVDFPVSREVFSGVEVKGGVSYFLWSRDEPGLCKFTSVRDGVSSPIVERRLDTYDILVRDSMGLALLKRVLSQGEPSFEEVVASVRPFGDKLRSNFRDYKYDKTSAYSVSLLVNEKGQRVEVWTKQEYVTSNQALAAGWKVFLPKAGSDGGQRLPSSVIGTPRLGRPGQVSTETYLAIGPFKTKREASNALAYLETQTARYLISLRKISQDNVPSTFKWLPIQDWQEPMTDESLRDKYRITREESIHINKMVAPWADSDG
jgi:site-specific DNA-methyltransferase (adenine-specific)